MHLDRTRRRSRTLTRLVGAAIALISVLALQSSASASLEDTLPEDTRFPGQGLPGYAQNPTTSGFWLAPQASSLTYAAAAKQWIGPPVFQAVADNLGTQNFNDPRCTDRLGKGIASRRDYRAGVVFVNTDVRAASTERFGRTQDFTVRTVAFGSIPVEADIALEQPRNAQGAVLPAIIDQRASSFCPGEGPFVTPPSGDKDGSKALTRTTMVGAVAVRVTGLRIDGVKIGPLQTCAATGAQLSLSAPDYYSWDPEPSPEERPSSADNILTTKYFNLANGGLLTGTLDVPGFDGCTTPDGDDLSPLLTAAVAGDDNPVTIRSEGLPPAEGLPDFSSPDDPGIVDCPWRNNDCDIQLPQLEIPDAPPGG